MTEEERKLINKLYFRKGLGVTHIIEIPCFSHLTKYAIYKHLNDKQGKIKKYKSEKAVKVIELKKKGYIYKEIAKITGLSIRTVYNYAMLDMQDFWCIDKIKKKIYSEVEVEILLPFFY